MISRGRTIGLEWPRKGELKMAYADNGGVRIHYEVEGGGAPLVLQHGYTDSMETWYDAGYVDGLQSSRRVILVDARGHGASDKPHDTTAYAKELQAADVVAVLRALNVSQADFWGYSMGGQIGFAMAKYARPRVRGLVIGGAAGAGSARASDRLGEAARGRRGANSRDLGRSLAADAARQIAGQRCRSAQGLPHRQSRVRGHHADHDHALPGICRYRRSDLRGSRGGGG